jgi:hypothetical protein
VALTKVILLGAAVLALSQQGNCGPQPTTADSTTQRQTAFFRVLVNERLQQSAGVYIYAMVFEDVSGGCYITSGSDGGVFPIAPSVCAKARTVDVERGK